MSHPHDFSAFPQHFGKYGDQTVHYHPCLHESGEFGEYDCSKVLVGDGRDCDGVRATHRLVNLDDGSGNT